RAAPRGNRGARADAARACRSAAAGARALQLATGRTTDLRRLRARAAGRVREDKTMDLTMRMGGAAAGETTSPLASARGAWLVVLLLTALGAYLRLANLGELGFRWDEDLTSLAVRAILEQGVPELPSGMIYLRGSWLRY